MNDEIVIKKVNSVNDCIVCNRLLEELICFESKFDSAINANHKIEEFYERTLNKEGSVIFLATHLNVPVGYIMAYIQKSSPAMNGNFVTIMNLFIKEEYRNMHLGTRLITEVEKWAKTIFQSFYIELDCIMDNKTAIDFYTKLDFKNVRVKMRKRYD